MTKEQQSHSPSGTAALIGSPVVSVVAAINQADGSGWINAPWVEQVPGIDHSSSVAGSYLIGIAGGTMTERIASRLEKSGQPKAAERARRFGNTLTVLSSVACQLTIEGTPHGGVSDKWDVIAGVIATAPGIIAGRQYGRIIVDGEQTTLTDKPATINHSHPI
jgi:hypothetical protein